MVNDSQKKRNLYVEFQQHSQDYLLLLGEKSRAASKNKSVAEELSTMELYHDGVDAIFRQYEHDLHLTRLRAATDHMIVAMLEDELRKAYNELFRMAGKYKDDVAVKKLFNESNIPTKKELEDYLAKDVILKTPDNIHEQRQQNGLGQDSGGGHSETTK